VGLRPRVRAAALASALALAAAAPALAGDVAEGPSGGAPSADSRVRAPEAPATALSCDLDRCIAAAFEHHPLFERAKAAIAAAEATVGQRQAERKPTISVSGETGYLRGASVSPFVLLGGAGPNGEIKAFVDGSYYLGSATVEVPVFKDGVITTQNSHYIREAQLLVGQEQLNRVALRRQIAAAVVTAYFNVLKYRGETSILESIVKAREADVKVMKAELQQKIVSPDQELVAEVNLATARHDVEYNGLLIRHSVQDLARALGLPLSTQIDVQESGSLPQAVPDLESALKRVGDAPDVKALQLAADAKHEDALYEQKKRLPSASVFGAYMIGDPYQLPVTDQASAWFKVTWTPWDFGLAKQKAAVALAEEREEKGALENTRLGLEGDLGQLYEHLQELETTSKLIDAQATQVTAGVRLNQALYDQGLVLLTALDEAQVQQLKVQLARIDNDYDRHQARSGIRVLNGDWDGQ
jgi:outer membrane protein TolC